MKDETGKWISAKNLMQILQELPPTARIYPNQVGNLNVIEAGSMSWLGMIDFMYGTYEPWGEGGDDEAAPA